MTSKPLDINTITAILARNDKDERKAATGIKAPEWPDADGKRAILEALGMGRNAVKIKNRYFRLRPRPSTGEVWVAPLDGGFAPCGHLNIRSLQEALLDG